VKKSPVLAIFACASKRTLGLGEQTDYFFFIFLTLVLNFSKPKFLLDVLRMQNKQRPDSSDCLEVLLDNIAAGLSSGPLRPAAPFGESVEKK